MAKKMIGEISCRNPIAAGDYNSGGDYIRSPSLFIDSFDSFNRNLPLTSGFLSDSGSPSGNESWPESPIDALSCDHFRMYEFKVRQCARGLSHDWTDCPFVHPGEKARRRDPRKYYYSGTACPEFRKGSCVKGDACEFAHGVFECWLHPARYRTQPCKDGTGCRRRICFFAHTRDQLRVLNGSGESGSLVSSPTSILVPQPFSPSSDSPPMSPCFSRSFDSMSELVHSLRKMQLGNGSQVGSRLMSPRHFILRPGFCSTPTTPTRTLTRSDLCGVYRRDGLFRDEPVMERVESGKELRAKMYAKLSKDNSLGEADSASLPPNFAWVSELVK